MIRAQGPDVLRFLQGLLSCDVEKMPVGSARAGTLLTVKGKILWDAVVLRHAEEVFELAVPAECADDAFTKLDRHLIMDEVELSRPSADTQLAVVAGVAPRAQDDTVQNFAGDYPVEGTLLRGTREAIAGLLAEHPRLDEQGFARHRVGAGLPAWGFEVHADHFPPEVGLVRGVSYDKGCFMGQEPLARIHARGQTNWVMVRVSCDQALGACVPGEPIALSHPDRENAGRCTTWAASPTASSTAGATAGLGIVHRKLARQGVELNDAQGRVFRVASGPLGDDAGNQGNQARRATVAI